MNIERTADGTKLTIALEGRLDMLTAPELDRQLPELLTGVNELTFDFQKLEYVSSAGLRVLLSAQEIMSEQGSMILKNVNDQIMEVFEVTGFTDILTIE